MATFDEALHRTLVKCKIQYSLRKEQYDALHHICTRNEKDAHHSFALLPTGFGKSDIFGLCPVILNMVCVEK